MNRGQVATMTTRGVHALIAELGKRCPGLRESRDGAREIAVALVAQGLLVARSAGIDAGDVVTKAIQFEEGMTNG